MKTLYDNARVLFASGQINWTTDNIKAVVLSPAYTPNISTDLHYSDISSYVLTGTHPIKTLTTPVTQVGTSPNIIVGALSADPVTFVALTSNQTIGFIVIFKDTGSTHDSVPISPSTAPLICIFDSGYGIGAGTNGYDVQITWDTTNGILRL